MTDDFAELLEGARVALTVRHVMDRLRGEFGDDAVRITDARAVLGRLLDDGEVHREAERNARGGVAR